SSLDPATTQIYSRSLHDALPISLGIDDHQTVHLVRQSDSLDRMLGFGVFAYQFLAAFADVLPPLVGVLFGESRLRGIDGHFGGWGRNDSNCFTGFCIHQSGLDRGASDIKSEQVFHHVGRLDRTTSDLKEAKDKEDF